MTRKLSFFDRLAVFLAGLILVFIGLIPVGLYFDIPVVSEWMRSLDRAGVATVQDWSWYPWALGGIAALLIILGLPMIVANLRGRGFSRSTFEDPEIGKTTVHLGRMASAIGDYLKQSEPVTGVDSSVAMVKKRATISFTVHADPHADLRTLVHLIESIEEDFRDAIEDLDMDTVYKIHLDKVEP